MKTKRYLNKSHNRLIDLYLQKQKELNEELQTALTDIVLELGITDLNSVNVSDLIQNRFIEIDWTEAGENT